MIGCIVLANISVKTNNFLTHINNFTTPTDKGSDECSGQTHFKGISNCYLLKDRKLVETEPKFKEIFNKLKELIDNSIEGPAKKNEELEKRKAEIEDEIRSSKREKTIKTFKNYQIKSRFDDVSKLTHELIGDFREVEENFRTIVRSIYEKQSDKSLSKGKMLQFTFDSLDEFKQTEQGEIFYAFWNFLLPIYCNNFIKKAAKLC